MATSSMLGRLSPADITVIVLYFVGTLGVGLWTICKEKGNLKGVFLAGRAMTWWPVGMSLFASNIGSVNYVGIAGSGAASGLAVIMFEWNAVWLLVLLGWIFLPVYIASGIYTMPEYLQWRFGGKRLRIYLSIVALATYIFATVSVDLFSGAVFLQQTLGLNLYGGVGLLLAVAFIFTALGGLETVILTDALAVVIMVLGGMLLCILGFVRLDGLAGLQYKYNRAVPDYTLNHTNYSCGYPREDAWHIFRHIWHADYPWLGTILRTTFGSLWYWCANQVLVQRALASKSLSHAKASCVLAGYLKLLPMFLMVLPGMMSRALFPNEVACADPDTCLAVCEEAVGCSNIALPKLVVELLPAGLRGLMVAAIIASSISSLTSIFNSSATLFSMDLWGEARPRATERELLLVGRIFVVFLTAVSLMWMPMISSAEGGEIFRTATTITGYLGAPTCAMFVLAMLWKRVTEPGAFWGMLIAQAWGLVRFVLDFVYPSPACGTVDNRPLFVSNFHAYYFTFSQIVLAFLLAAVISCFTRPVYAERVAGLTYWSRMEKPLKDKQAETAWRERQGKPYPTSPNDDHNSETSSLDQTTGRQVESYDDCAEVDPQVSPETASTVRQNDDDKSNINASSERKASLRERFLTALIGSKKSTGKGTGDATPGESHSARLLILRQSAFWKRFLMTQAVLLMVATSFLYGFFH